MIVELLKRSMIGIAFGAISTFIALIILLIYEMEATVFEIWLNMLASMLIGIYFGIGSFIWENDKWSPLKKTVIHFSLSLLVYLAIAIPVGWVPFTWLALLISISIFTIAYALYWFGFSLYYKKMESSMNDFLHKK